MIMLTAVLTGVVLLSSSLPAQDREAVQKKAHEWELKIEAVRKEAEGWEAKGWEGRAAEMRAQADKMRREFEVWMREQKQRLAGQPDKAKDRPGAGMPVRMEFEEAVATLHGLEQGIAALRKLGRMDMADMCKKVAAELRDKVTQRKQQIAAEQRERADADRKRAAEQRERGERARPEAGLDGQIQVLQKRLAELERQLVRLRASLEQAQERRR